MEVRDYNGTGKWTMDAILARYRIYASELGIAEPLDLAPSPHSEGEITWIYPVMFEVITAIDAGDPACVRIGIEFIQEDARFPFGKILKSNTARALRRAELSDEQKDTIRQRVVHMLVNGDVPREFKEYARLLRTIGFSEYWPRIEKEVNRNRKYVMR